MYYRQLSVDIKMKNYKINISFVSPELRMAELVLIQRILIGFEAILDNTFHIGLEPALIYRILIGFEALL